MLMARLKQETRPYHDQIEGDPLSRGMLGGSLSLPSYLGILTVYYGLYAPLEERIAVAADWAGLGLDLGPRRKAPMLARDMGHLGLGPAAIADLPRCQHLPALGGLPAAIGSLYVLEGSTLGGQLIARHLREALGLTPEAGLAFFTSYGPMVGPMWREFAAFADAYGSADPAAAVRAAGETYRALGAWFRAGYQRLTTHRLDTALHG